MCTLQMKVDPSVGAIPTSGFTTTSSINHNPPLHQMSTYPINVSMHMSELPSVILQWSLNPLAISYVQDSKVSINIKGSLPSATFQHKGDHPYMSHGWVMNQEAKTAQQYQSNTPIFSED